MADSYLMNPMSMNGGAQAMLPFYDANAIAQNQADMLGWQQKQQLAQQMLQNPIIPHGGRGGAIAGILTNVLGALAQNRNNDKLADILKSQFQIQNQAATAKRQQELQDEQRKLQEDIYKAVQSARGEAQAKKEFATKEAVGGGAFIMDPATGQLTINPDFNKTQLELAQGKAKIEAANRQGPADPFREIKAGVAAGVISPEQAMQAMQTKLLGKDNAPPGYQWNGAGLQPIPGGPADPATQRNKPIPADMAGKISLAEGYLQNFPTIQSEIGKGTMTGLLDANTAQAGYGKGGEVYRQIQSGRDALQRTLTGAGMPASEASEYANRYLPTTRDTASTLASKQRQLQDELQRFVTIAKTGQDITPDVIKAQTQGINLSDPQALGKGAPTTQPTATATGPNGQKIGLVNGQWVPL